MEYRRNFKERLRTKRLEAKKEEIAAKLPIHIGMMHFAGTIEIPVYSSDKKPETIYNV